MIKMIITLVTIMTIWLFSGLDWMEGIITVQNLANLALVILGILITSAASQLRLVLEKVENILSVYAKYTIRTERTGKSSRKQSGSGSLTCFYGNWGAWSRNLVPGSLPGLARRFKTLLKLWGFVRNVIDLNSLKGSFVRSVLPFSYCCFKWHFIRIQ